MTERLDVYKWYDVNLATFDDSGNVYQITLEDIDPADLQAYASASRLRAGMFGKLVEKLSRAGMFYVVPRFAPKKKTIRIGHIDEFDGVSLSSINRPYSKLIRSKHLKSSIERWANPFALITDGVRNIHTFLYQMPTVVLSDELRRMFVKSRLPIKQFKYELFGIPAFTVFVDKDNEEVNKLLREITGIPVSLDGDGFVVSKAWTEQIQLLTNFGEIVPLPSVFKMQGPARSKGIVIATFDMPLTVEYRGMTLPVHVIMNTQLSRKNKAANITAAAMRLRRFMGEEIEEIDTTDVNQLVALKNKYKFETATLHVGNRKFEVLFGISKYYIDLTHRFAPKIANANIQYVQAKQIYEVLDYPLLSRFTFRKKQIEEEIELTDNLITVCDEIREYFTNLIGGGQNDRK